MRVKSGIQITFTSLQPNTVLGPKWTSKLLVARETAKFINFWSALMPIVYVRGI